MTLLSVQFVASCPLAGTRDTTDDIVRDIHDVLQRYHATEVSFRSGHIIDEVDEDEPSELLLPDSLGEVVTTRPVLTLPRLTPVLNFMFMICAMCAHPLFHSSLFIPLKPRIVTLSISISVSCCTCVYIIGNCRRGFVRKIMRTFEFWFLFLQMAIAYGCTLYVHYQSGVPVGLIGVGVFVIVLLQPTMVFLIDSHPSGSKPVMQFSRAFLVNFTMLVLYRYSESTMAGDIHKALTTPIDFYLLQVTPVTLILSSLTAVVSFALRYLVNIVFWRSAFTILCLTAMSVPWRGSSDHRRTSGPAPTGDPLQVHENVPNDPYEP